MLRVPQGFCIFCKLYKKIMFDNYCGVASDLTLYFSFSLSRMIQIPGIRAVLHQRRRAVVDQRWRTVRLVAVFSNIYCVGNCTCFTVALLLYYRTDILGGLRMQLTRSPGNWRAMFISVPHPARVRWNMIWFLVMLVMR